MLMDFLRQIIYAALGAGAVFYLFVRFSLSYWKRRGILHEPPKFLYGNLKHIFRKRHVAALLEELYNKYQGKAPFIGVYAYLNPMVLILDPQLVQRIMVRDAELFAERDLYNDAEFDPMSFNLMQLDSKLWQRLRRKVQTCYSANRLPELMPALKRVAEDFRTAIQQKRWQEEKLDISNLVDCWNLDVISYLVFGSKLQSVQKPQSEFREQAHRCWRKLNLFHAYLALSYPKATPFLMYKSYDFYAGQYFKLLLKDKIIERTYKNEERHHDMLELFINTQHESHESLRLNENEILVEVFSFVAFGLDACNSTLAFCLYELAFAETIQNRARDEIVNVLQKHHNEITFEAIKEMKYLKQILYETLRLYTPYPLVVRKTLSNYEVPQSVFMLRKGQRLIVPIAAIHRDARIYPDPLEFDPSRFEESAIKSRHCLSFFPFGTWPRDCPAGKFVELQMLVCLVTLLRQYKFSACSETCRPPLFDPKQFVLKPKEPIILLVEHLKGD